MPSGSFSILMPMQAHSPASIHHFHAFVALYILHHYMIYHFMPMQTQTPFSCLHRLIYHSLAFAGSLTSIHSALSCLRGTIHSSSLMPSWLDLSFSCVCCLIFS
ncbi:hypothetical protein AMECASPLE_023596 [Ameca splendens]|uniref:Uncharacterized protein n=1 Tax=Ameca splendens TaxID=208324 RepID=A0ABV0XT43_9TELE